MRRGWVLGGLLVTAAGLILVAATWPTLTACVAFNAGGCHTGPSQCQVYELCPYPEIGVAVVLTVVGATIALVGVLTTSRAQWTREALQDRRP